MTMKVPVATASGICYQVLHTDMQAIVAFDNKADMKRFLKNIRTYITKQSLQGQIRQTILPNVYDDKIIYVIIVDKAKGEEDAEV